MSRAAQASSRLPLIIAHRGSAAEAPEHSLAAYQQALEDGADGWECDVRLTRDGYLVCVHDRRLDRTSNGRGSVSRRRLVELEELEFGSPQRSAPRGQVLTLERLLELFVDCGPPLRLFIETKHPTRHGGLVEQRLIELLQRFGLADPVDPTNSPVTIMSLWPRPLRRIHQMAPKLPTVQLLVAVPPPFRDGSLPWGIPISGPWIRLLRSFPEYADRAHAAGKQVYVWTVDEPSDIDLVASLGVEAIITNRPAATLARLRPQKAGKW